MNIRKKIWLLAIGVSLSVTGVAQQEAVDRYMQTAGDNALIYSGELEAIYAQSAYLNKPYLDGEDYLPGNMVYNGNKYANQLLRFNLFKEQLSILAPANKIGVNLDMRKVSRFVIGTKSFVDSKELPAGIPEEGYIQLLFDGPQVKVLVKRKCSFNASVIYNNVSYAAFSFRDKYYFFSDGVYRPINSRRLLYKLYPQYKKQLKRYSRDKSLDFRGRYESSLYELVEHLQQLITQTTK